MKCDLSARTGWFDAMSLQRSARISALGNAALHGAMQAALEVGHLGLALEGGERRLQQLGAGQYGNEIDALWQKKKDLLLRIEQLTLVRD